MEGFSFLPREEEGTGGRESGSADGRQGQRVHGGKWCHPCEWLVLYGKHVYGKQCDGTHSGCRYAANDI